MKTTGAEAGKAELTLERTVRCAECGWPGIGNMPTGVRVINTVGKQVLIGQLSYYPMCGVLCSVCQAMESAVSIRPWFIEAQAEYLDQIKVKKQLMGGK